MWVREGLLEKWLSHLMLDYKEELGRRREDWNDFPPENITCDYCHVESKFGAVNDSMARLANNLSLILALLGFKKKRKKVPKKDQQPCIQ